MGIFNYGLLWLSSQLFLIFLLITNPFQAIVFSTAKLDEGITSTGINQPPAEPSPPPPLTTNSSAFKPGIFVIGGVLTTVVCLILLLLLYAKHCRSRQARNAVNFPITTERNNSGIDRAVVESMPIFRFKSLRGQKEGLECAVCLNRFEPIEVLRLLPKCKHAFHVECVDTWLDNHSTCPLCRYRVDPEDILLVDCRSTSRGRLFGGGGDQDSNAATPKSISSQSSHQPLPPRHSGGNEALLSKSNIARVSGRHSSAGERGSSSLLEVIVEQPTGRAGSSRTPSFISRRSLDSWRSFNIRKASKSKRSTANDAAQHHQRKDGLLLADKTGGATGEHKLLDQRIIISRPLENSGPQERWSAVDPSDMLLLQSEMILTDSRALTGSRGSKPSISSSSCNNASSSSSGSKVINERSLSEFTGLSRFRSNEDEGQQRRKQQRGAVSRWLAWTSNPKKQPVLDASASLS